MMSVPEETLIAGSQSVMVTSFAESTSAPPVEEVEETRSLGTRILETRSLEKSLEEKIKSIVSDLQVR